jgi:hypothetical protein
MMKPKCLFWQYDVVNMPKKNETFTDRSLCCSVKIYEFRQTEDLSFLRLGTKLCEIIYIIRDK